MNTYRKKNYRGKRSYGGRPHRRTADSYHQPLPQDLSRIPYGRHTLTKPDVEAVVDALLSGTLTQGKELQRFETLLSKLTHSEYAIAMSSGTAAIHAALACLKLEPEDEIITSTLNFCSVSNMVRLAGAKPVLVDCDPNTLTLSVEAAKAAVTPNTKAIFTNNFGGHPSELTALRELCDDHNLVLLEDACHGLGGKYSGHYIGNQADLTCFSFHPSKAITTCEGGAVTTNNRAIAEWLRQFRHHGIQKEARFFKGSNERPDFYQELQFLGMNYRMSELHAALGRSQLTRLDRHIERRRAIAQVYYQKLGPIEELILPYDADWAENAFHLFPIQLIDSLATRRDSVFNDLKEAGIDVQVHYVPVHRMPFYVGKLNEKERFPNAETYFSRALSLPLFPDLSYKDLERITDVLLKVVNKYISHTQMSKRDGEEIAVKPDSEEQEKPYEKAVDYEPFQDASLSVPPPHEKNDSQKLHDLEELKLGEENASWENVAQEESEYQDFTSADQTNFVELSDPSHSRVQKANSQENIPGIGDTNLVEDKGNGESDVGSFLDTDQKEALFPAEEKIVENNFSEDTQKSSSRKSERGSGRLRKVPKVNLRTAKDSKTSSGSGEKPTRSRRKPLSTKTSSEKEDAPTPKPRSRRVAKPKDISEGGEERSTTRKPRGRKPKKEDASNTTESIE